jgi:hypothetical protein
MSSWLHLVPGLALLAVGEFTQPSTTPAPEPPTATHELQRSRALAQADFFTRRGPSGDYRISGNRRIIAAQVELARARAQHALTLLTATMDADTLDETIALVEDGYVLLRTAIHGLRTARAQRPVSEVILRPVEELVEQARADLRVCLVELDRVRRGQMDRLPMTLDLMRSALTHTDLALDLVR